jgi:hypothetical protein
MRIANWTSELAIHLVGSTMRPGGDHLGGFSSLVLLFFPAGYHKSRGSCRAVTVHSELVSFCRR